MLQRLAQAGAVALAVLLGLGLVDFGLRLPAMLRGALMAVLVVALGLWLGLRLVRALRFSPSLTDLALRAERLYPQLTGVLASAVEFVEHAPAYAAPARTAALAEASRKLVDGPLEPGKLARLLAPRRTLIFLAAALGLTVVAGATFATVPELGRIAAARWFTPWADVQWPKRTAVMSLTHERSWAADTALPMRAAVERGHRRGMRVWVNFRLVDHHGRSGQWRRVLMSEQAASGTTDAMGQDVSGSARAMPVAYQTAAPRFERLIELTERLPPTDDHGSHCHIEYYFEAGDDRTASQAIELIERPTVTAVVASIEPPTYARGLIEPQEVDLRARRDRRAAVDALTGSTVTLHIALNKPLRITGDDVSRLVPGMADEVSAGNVRFEAEGEDHARLVRQVTLRFPLRMAIETPIELEDEHGFANLSDRIYAIEAMVDELPSASLLEPGRDESVLAGAEVYIEALAQDDVGVESVAVVAEVPAAAAEGTPYAVTAAPDAREPDDPDEARASAASDSDEARVELTLTERTGRQSRLSESVTLDLSELALSTGDVVTLFAVGRDVYELDGDRHEPVRSAPRRLRIIDAATLTRQIRSELGGVRQQAVRLENRQRQLEEQEASEARTEQARLTRQIESQSALVRRLEDRAARNRLDEPALDQLLEESGGFLEDATDASRAAAEGFEQAVNADDEQRARDLEQTAREHQQEVRAALSDLVSLLEQGQEAMALQLELRRLRTDQRNIEQATRELLPETAGSALEDLPQELRERLEELAERQREASDQAEELIEQMRAAAQALAQADDERSEAVAEALAEAAELAEREGLSQRMDESFEAIDQNRLSQAGQDQAEALDTMQRMLEQMGEHERRMQAMLRRRLAELAGRLEELIERQQERLTQFDDRPAGAELASRAEGQLKLRQATMAAAEQARGNEQTAGVAEPIELAVDAQGEAVRGLRGEEADRARAGKREALVQLEAALELVRQQHEQAQREEAAERRRELQAAYQELAERQETLRTEVLELTEGDEPMDRRRRNEMVGRGQDQEQLRGDAAELAEQVVEHSLLFEYLHERVEAAASDAARRLRQAEASDPVTRAQARVAADLRRMAAALETPEEEADFASAAAGDGAGEGQGDASPEPPIVPPVAELRLMRELQQATLEQTRELDQQVRGDPDEPARQRLAELSNEQRELADLGERLIERMQQRMEAFEAMRDAHQDRSEDADEALREGEAGRRGR